MGNGEMQSVEGAQRLIDEAIDEIRRDDRLIVEKRLDLQETSSDVGFERPKRVPLVFRRNLAGSLAARQKRPELDYGQAADQGQLLVPG